eukprot:15235455-Alexandrium_andersonii.AAC.1
MAVGLRGNSRGGPARLRSRRAVSEFVAAASGGLATTRCGTRASRLSGRAERRTLRSTPPLSARPSCAGLRLRTPAKDG